MAHNIDMSNGRANVAFVNSPLWHNLGSQLNEDSSIEDWIETAGFNWDIIKTPVSYATGDGTMSVMDDKHVLYRSDTNAPLSVVGNDYKIIQPKEVLEFFRDLVDGTGMYLETAGCLFGGRKFWAMANTTKSSYVGKKEDTIKGYLFLATSADGTIATTAQFTSVRLACANTLKIALAEKETNRVRVTHRSDFDAEMVKRKMGLIDEAWVNFLENMNDLASKKISDAGAKAFIDSLILTKPDDPEKSSTQSKNQSEFIMGLYKGAGMGADAAYGNMFGVLNSITEFVDHHSRKRTNDSKLWNQFFGAGDKLKQDALETLLEMV